MSMTREEIAAMVQADGERTLVGPGAPAPVQHQAPSAGMAPAAATPPQNATTPETTTGPGGEKLYAGKFKTIEELEKAHHILMGGYNSLKGENDRVLARLATGEAPAAPLSPGRVDPSAGQRSDADNQLWQEQYGINPADIDARIDKRLSEINKSSDAVTTKMQTADAYMAQNYPEFLTRVDEVKAFVQASPVLRERVAALWANGLFAEAMEIGHLAYDNALRATQIAQNINANTQSAVGQDRADATMLTSQAGGSREALPNPTAFPQTEQDWERVRDLRRRGKDAEANKILYGGLIAHIPELNPRM